MNIWQIQVTASSPNITFKGKARGLSWNEERWMKNKTTVHRPTRTAVVPTISHLMPLLAAFVMQAPKATLCPYPIGWTLTHTSLSPRAWDTREPGCPAAGVTRIPRLCRKRDNSGCGQLDLNPVSRTCGLRCFISTFPFPKL